MGEAKQCPFCGSSGSSLWARWYRKTSKYYVWVQCDVCGAKTRGVPGTEVDPEDNNWDDEACRDALALWNTRKELFEEE